jgi:hypothetical protein
MLHKQFEELTETGDGHAGIFFLNHATTYNKASVKVNPDPPPQPGQRGDLVALCHRTLSQTCQEFVGFFILPNYAGKILGIVRGLSAAILYRFVLWNPQVLPFYTM